MLGLHNTTNKSLVIPLIQTFKYDDISEYKRNMKLQNITKHKNNVIILDLKKLSKLSGIEEKNIMCSGYVCMETENLCDEWIILLTREEMNGRKYVIND